MLFSDVARLRHNHIIGVQDNAGNTARFVMDEFIKSECNTSEIHVFCYDRHYLRLQNELNISNSNVHFHDCFPKLENSDSVDEFKDFIMSMNSKKFSSKKLILIVDSLTTLILVKNLSFVYRMLNKLIIDPESTGFRGQIQVMVIIHEDTILNINHTLKQLKHICRVWIHIKPSTVTVTVRKSSGKVSNQNFEFEFGENDEIVIKKVKHPTADTKSGDAEENLPTSTFKLTLSENEKKARDAVKLPYEKNQCNETGPEEGKIFYEPDEFDDWDEEDPDNDLEFT